MKTAVTCILILCASTGHALTLTDCDRTTHISHGGEADHRDLGEGRVMWRDWWSQEGTATSFAIVDCGLGAALTFRTAEDNMGTRLPFDKTAKALRILAQHENGARAFATFDRIAADLDGTAKDIEITTLDAEPCACAALYPDDRGDKTEFKLAG
ncbi:hypothetical protein [uncultured Tateyamaria sp.]|uniref:hypothetical protein n=1 Tax=Tateyamaria sp. 1078 TaxID=3417464 RepID=UPI00261498CA|nr:hypothetical protein [uncultured Tateyamaria sp.]